MKKLLFALFSILILTGCSSRSPENSEEYSDSEVTVETTAVTLEAIVKSNKNQKYDFEVSDDSIKIIADGGALQTINGDFSVLTEYSSPTTLIDTEDYNFDGYNDLFVPTKFYEDYFFAAFCNRFTYLG